MTRKIKDKDGNVVAFLIGEIDEGTKPLTDDAFGLQAVTLKYSKGKKFDAHTHEIFNRQSDIPQECLMVLKGLVEVRVLTRANEELDTLFLTPGQGIFIVNGGMSVQFHENSECIEFKNGPYTRPDKINL